MAAAFLKMHQSIFHDSNDDVALHGQIMKKNPVLKNDTVLLFREGNRQKLEKFAINNGWNRVLPQRLKSNLKKKNLRSDFFFFNKKR